jgi:hypothetical protein
MATLSIYCTTYTLGHNIWDMSRKKCKKTPGKDRLDETFE